MRDQNFLVINYRMIKKIHDKYFLFHNSKFLITHVIKISLFNVMFFINYVFKYDIDIVKLDR